MPEPRGETGEADGLLGRTRAAAGDSDERPSCEMGRRRQGLRSRPVAWVRRTAREQGSAEDEPRLWGASRQRAQAIVVEPWSGATFA